MDTIKARRGGMFACPACERDQFFVEEVGSELAQPYPTNWFVCAGCGNRLVEDQQRPARPFDKSGGCLLPAWLFKCDDCESDFHIDRTIYDVGSDGSSFERPPKSVNCTICGKLFQTEYGGSQGTEHPEQKGQL